MVEFPTFMGSWPWPWPWIRAWSLPFFHLSSSTTCTPNFIEIEDTFCGRTDGNLPPMVLGRLPKFESRPKKGHVTLTTPTMGSSTLALDIFYLHSAHKIWLLSLKPLRRYDCRRRNWQEALLRQRDRATRYVSKSRPCNVSRGMGVRKVSNS